MDVQLGFAVIGIVFGAIGTIAGVIGVFWHRPLHSAREWMKTNAPGTNPIVLEYLNLILGIVMLCAGLSVMILWLIQH